MVASVSLLAPYGLLACLLALVPLAVVALAFRRQRRVSRALGLEPVPGRRALRAAALPAVACLMLGVAVAEPAITTTTERSARTSSEVVFVTDVSRSMTASSGPGAPTRLDRARSIVAELRRSVPDVPAGLSGLTDRVLPYAFPTLDPQTFSSTLAGSVQAESPPPQAISDVATSFEPLSALSRDGFYTPGTEHRTCVLVTDGETRTASLVERGLQAPGGQGGVGGRPHLRRERQGRRRLPSGEHGGGHGRPARSRSRLGAVLGR